MELKTKNILYQNKIIFYRIIGEGQPLLLLHGFAEDGEIWQHQINFLKDKCQLIVPDIPGSGSSAFNEQLSTIEDHADAIKVILDNEKITNCIFIGHSLGGYIALAFAEKYPQLLKAFGLFHSTVFADSEERKQIRLKAIELIKSNGAYAFIKATTPNLFTDNFKIKNPEQVNELIEQGRNFLPEALIQYYKIMLVRPDRTYVLRNFSKPVLFIIGELDNIIPFQSSLQQCHLPAQSHVHILAKSAHMGMWEESAKSNEILFNFLKIITN
jgi:pimeloyl-ACP methyl ester carboxylesterase